MNFVIHLPQTLRGHDAVWVIMYRLTELAYFLVVRMTFTLEKFYRLYIREIIRLHGVLVSIASDRDPRFMITTKIVLFYTLINTGFEHFLCTN